MKIGLFDGALEYMQGDNRKKYLKEIDSRLPEEYKEIIKIIEGKKILQGYLDYNVKIYHPAILPTNEKFEKIKETIMNNENPLFIVSPLEVQSYKKWFGERTNLFFGLYDSFHISRFILGRTKT